MLLCDCCVLLSADELCGAELLPVDELSTLLDELELDEFDELDELDELLEDELVKLVEPELSDKLPDELSAEADEPSETLPLISSREVTFPAQPVHSSIAARTNAADLDKSFFIIRSFDRT